MSGGDRPAHAAWTGARGNPTRLILLRHGQTALSVDRRYSGRTDVALTDHGQQQAAAAAKRIAARYLRTGDPRVVSSPLARATATAQQAADAVGAEVIVHDGLLETDFGAWEGLTFREAAQRDPELHRAWLGDPAVSPPGGESFDAVHQRVRATLDDLTARFAGRELVVVSHVTPIKTVLRIALSAGHELLFRLHLDLASISVVEFYPDGNSSVLVVNDISHLDGL